MLRITSCLAANTEIAGWAIASYISERLQMPAEFVDDISWQERERLLDSGNIHVGWICGLLYVWKARRRTGQALELLATPVMAGKRYQDRPVYFSDVVVRRDSPFRCFADLRGCTWAYNEPRSYSGHYLVCYHLARLGESFAYFGKMVASGAHQASLQMVLNYEVDASAIDSTVLDFELRQQPDLRHKIRVVTILGPSPAPPWIVSCGLLAEVRGRLRTLLLQMHDDPGGRSVLRAGQLARFARAGDADYDAIRSVARGADAAILQARFL